MKGRFRLACALAVAVAAPGPRDARAAVGCGVIITNTATITMWGGAGYPLGYEMSYCATARAMVFCPTVRCFKTVAPVAAGAGDALTFRLWVANDVKDTIWGVTVTDNIPPNVSFETVNVQNFNAGTVTTTNALALTGPWVAGGPTAGQTAPYYLRWVVPSLGPLKSACVSFTARIL